MNSMNMPQRPEFEILTDAFELQCAVYKILAEKYEIKSAYYPGSGDDIIPSLYIPQVTYVDNSVYSNNFFCQTKRITRYLNKNKIYPDPCQISFHYQDYQSPLHMAVVDLLISQYAGSISQIAKSHLRLGGFLLVSDSDSNSCDSFLAMCDPDYALLRTVVPVIADNVCRCYIDSGIQPRSCFFPTNSPYSQGVPLLRNFLFQKIH